MFFVFFFFFSSRRRHTRFDCDWSSDVCSSDLARFIAGLPHGAYFGIASLVAASLVPSSKRAQAVGRMMLGLSVANVLGVPRSEERRVGKECRSRWSPYH